MLILYFVFVCGGGGGVTKEIINIAISRWQFCFKSLVGWVGGKEVQYLYYSFDLTFYAQPLHP